MRNTRGIAWRTDELSVIVKLIKAAIRTHSGEEGAGGSQAIGNQNTSTSYLLKTLSTCNLQSGAIKLEYRFLLVWSKVTAWLWMLYGHLLVLKMPRYADRLQLDRMLWYNHKGTELKQFNFGITPVLTSDFQIALFNIFWSCIYFYESPILWGINAWHTGNVSSIHKLSEGKRHTCFKSLQIEEHS